MGARRGIQRSGYQFPVHAESGAGVMTGIQTVLGPVAAGELGPTLMHEHIINVSPGIWRSWPELLGGQESFLDSATALLKMLKEETGVTSIVDLSSADIGRDAQLLRDLSLRSGMHIVMCTGHHRHFTLTTSQRSVEEFESWFTREIEVGADGTESRAAVIKVASDKGGVQPAERRVLHAAAKTQIATRCSNLGPQLRARAGWTGPARYPRE